MENSEQLQKVQGLMVLLSSLANGLDEVFGQGAASITYRAGRTVGLKTAVRQQEREDLLKALEIVSLTMNDIGIHWAFEPYKKKEEAGLITVENDQQQIQLVFRNCMVRSSLFRYGHPQHLSLCMMNHGLFCGLLEKVCGLPANLNITHAGENACLKVLTVGKAR
jgi:predicted hydrocarbon binding protein